MVLKMGRSNHKEVLNQEIQNFSRFYAFLWGVYDDDNLHMEGLTGSMILPLSSNISTSCPGAGGNNRGSPKGLKGN